MKKWIQFLGTALFLMLAVLATLRINKILAWKDDQGIRQFYEYEEECMDVVSYGSSHNYCTVNTALLWEKYGMAAYNMGESAQNFGSTFYYIKETLKTQNPKVLLVEASSLVGVDEGLANGNLYRNTLGMKYSENYIGNMEYALSQAEIPGGDTEKYRRYIFTKYPVYHSRYDELTKEDFVQTDITKGRFKSSWTCEAYEVPEACKNTERTPLTDEERYWLDQVVELTREEGIELILWIAPYVVPEIRMTQFNSIKDYAAEHDIPFFNFNEIYEEIGFNYKTDMRKEQHTGSHLNNFGAEKVTGYLGKYLHDHYDLPDHSGDPSYGIYQTIYENWLLDVEAHEAAVKGN